MLIMIKAFYIYTAIEFFRVIIIRNKLTYILFGVVVGIIISIVGLLILAMIVGTP